VLDQVFVMATTANRGRRIAREVQRQGRAQFATKLGQDAEKLVWIGKFYLFWDGALRLAHNSADEKVSTHVKSVTICVIWS
jgi:hypothetical protein